MWRLEPAGMCSFPHSMDSHMHFKFCIFKSKPVNCACSALVCFWGGIGVSSSQSLPFRKSTKCTSSTFHTQPGASLVPCSQGWLCLAPSARGGAGVTPLRGPRRWRVGLSRVCGTPEKVQGPAPHLSPPQVLPDPDWGPAPQVWGCPSWPGWYREN